MSTGTPASVAPSPPVPPSQESREIKIVSHSNLFYWWPVWAAGFLMALITAIDGHRMVIVPKSAIHQLPDKSGYEIDPAQTKLPADHPPRHMSQHKTVGVIFATVLLLVIIITNVPLRGMWSILVIVSVILISVIIQLAGLTEWLFTTFSYLDIRINLGGYLFISIFLFIIWCLTVFLFDRRVYIVFSPRQLKVCTEVGGGEKVYDAVGLALEKQQSDFFRHLIIGLGAGDLVVKTSGAQSHHFDLPNVLFIASKVHAIENLLKKQLIENK